MRQKKYRCDWTRVKNEIVRTEIAHFSKYLFLLIVLLPKLCNACPLSYINTGYCVCSYVLTLKSEPAENIRLKYYCVVDKLTNARICFFPLFPVDSCNKWDVMYFTGRAVRLYNKFNDRSERYRSIFFSGLYGGILFTTKLLENTFQARSRIAESARRKLKYFDECPRCKVLAEILLIKHLIKRFSYVSFVWINYSDIKFHAPFEIGVTEYNSVFSTVARTAFEFESALEGQPFLRILVEVHIDNTISLFLFLCSSFPRSCKSRRWHSVYPKNLPASFSVIIIISRTLRYANSRQLKSPVSLTPRLTLHNIRSKWNKVVSD